LHLYLNNSIFCSGFVAKGKGLEGGIAGSGFVAKGKGLEGGIAGSTSENSSQSPPHINHCCYECGDPLDDIFCKRCTCKSCGKDAHIGYNCPPKVLVISNPKPCNNQTIDELPQTLPSFHPTFHSEAESPFTLDLTPTYVDESPNVLNLPPQPLVYSCELCGNDAYYGHYCTPQALFIYPEPCYNQDFNFPQDFQNVPQQYPCCDDCGVTHDAYQCQPMNEVYYYGQNSCYDSTSIGFDQSQPQQYTLEEKQLEEERAAKAQNWKLPICYDDDDDEERSDSLDDNIISGLPPFSAITPDEPSCSNEDVLEKIISKPLFEEEIIPMKIKQHLDNAESDLMESLRTHDSFLPISSKINSLLDEFAGELALLKSILPGIDETDYLFDSQNTLMEQLTSMCDMVSQFIQKKEEEKQIEEDQAANTRYWKIPACYDDDDNDYAFAITPNEPVNSLSMRDEHVDTIPAMESDEFIKYSVKNLIPIPSESEGKNECDMPACEGFRTFSNILFDAYYDFYSVDDRSFSDEDIDSLFDELAGELTLLKSIPPGIDETDCDPEEEICLIEKLLYDNSSPRPPEEFVFKNSNVAIESFSPTPISVEDCDSLMEEIDLSFTLDYPMPTGIEDDDYESERDILISEDLLSNDSLSLLKLSHFILIFLYSLVLLQNHQMEKSPDHLSHLGHETFQLFANFPMMIHGKNIPILDVPVFYFYPLDQLK
nr:hypothetical protein [Tanacetum cinerariifolium]